MWAILPYYLKGNNMTNKAQTVSVEWHNDTQSIAVNPVPDAPEMYTSIDLTIMCGRTVPDGDKVKRAGWMVKAISDGAEFEAKNFASAVNLAVRAKAGGTKFHDVKAAVIELKLPELQADEEAKPTENVDWTTFDNAEFLASERDAASDAATKFFSGESDMRQGLKSLGVHIAEVAESLSNPKAFNAWVDSGTGDLRKALPNKNSMSELLFVGRLPQDYFDKQPETSNSAKSYQRNFNNDKNDIADDIAQAAWGKKQTAPKAAVAQKVFFEVLSEIAELDTSRGILAASMLDHLNISSENASVLIFADDDSGMTVAKDSDGTYIAGTQFGAGNRAHELALAFCKAMKANAPEAKAEAEEKEAETKAASALKPRVFADYGVTEAAMHIARILSSRDDWADVLDSLNGMADRAETETWQQVLSDVAAGVTAEAATAEAEAAEADGDDDA